MSADARRATTEGLRLDGRCALVTGAGQGIGRGFALALAEAGARVAVIDIDAERAKAVTSQLAAKGCEAMHVAADVAQDGAMRRCVEAVLERWGGLEIAVNNAGINRNSPAERTSPQEWDEVFRLNSRAVFLGCQAEAEAMFDSGYGKIINTASMAATVVPYPQKQAAYNGIIRTALIEESPALRPLIDEWVGQIPLARLGEIKDLKSAIVFLAAPASDYMTGHNLVNDGGQSLRANG